MKKLSYIAAALLLASVSVAHADPAGQSSTPSNDPAQATSKDANSGATPDRPDSTSDDHSVDRAERPDVAERPEVAEKPETPDSNSHDK